MYNRDGYDFDFSLVPFNIRADLDDFGIGPILPITYPEGWEQRTGDFDPGFITEFTTMHHTSTSEIVLTANAPIPRGSMIYIRLITANAEYRPCQAIDPADPGEPGGPWVFPSGSVGSDMPDRITDSQGNIWTVSFRDAPFRDAMMGPLDAYDGFHWYNDPDFVGIGNYFRWKTEDEINGQIPYALGCHLDEGYAWSTQDGEVGAYQPAYVEGSITNQNEEREYWIFPWQPTGSWLRHGEAFSLIRNDLDVGDTITIPLVKPIFNASTILSEWQELYGNATDGWFAGPYNNEWWDIFNLDNPNGGTPQPIGWEACPVPWAYARATAWSNLTIPLPTANSRELKDSGSFGTWIHGDFWSTWPYGGDRHGGMCPHNILAHPRDSGFRQGGEYHFDQNAGFTFSNGQNNPNVMIEFEVWRLWDSPGVVHLGNLNPTPLPGTLEFGLHIPPEWNVPEGMGLSTEPPDPHHENLNDDLGSDWPWQRSTHVLPDSNLRDGLVVERFWARSQPVSDDIKYWRYAWPRNEFEYDIMDHNLPDAEPVLNNGNPGTPGTLRGDQRPSMYDAFNVAVMRHTRVGPRLMWAVGDALSSPAASLTVYLQHEHDDGSLSNEGNTGHKMTVGHSYGYGARPGDTIFAVTHTFNDANGENDAVVTDSQGNEWVCLGKTPAGVPGHYTVAFWQCNPVNPLAPATTYWPTNADGVTLTSDSRFKAISVFCFDHVEGVLAYVHPAYATDAPWGQYGVDGLGWKGNVPIAREIDSTRGHTAWYIHAGYGQPWSEYSAKPHSTMRNAPEPDFQYSPVCHFRHNLADFQTPDHNINLMSSTTVSWATNHGNGRFWLRNQVSVAQPYEGDYSQIPSGHLVISDHGEMYGASHGSASAGAHTLMHSLDEETTEVTERMPADSGPVVLAYADEMGSTDVPRSVEPIGYEGDAIYCGPF